MTTTNPLFPIRDDLPTGQDSYLLERREHRVHPAADGKHDEHKTAAIDLIRSKLAQIYAEPPDTSAERQQVTVVQPRSKHQQFMYELSTSGRSLAEIQTAWQDYYAALSDTAKHEVWREFYQSSATASRHPETPDNRAAGAKPDAYTPQAGRSHIPPQSMPPSTSPQHAVVSVSPHPAQPATDLRTNIRETVAAAGRLQPKHHLQSLLFGLSVGAVTLLIFLFGFFNELVIAPFIQPGRAAGATPIIVNPASVTAGNTPEIIIPKLNLEIPVDFSQTSTDEATIEQALENGIVHYPSTVLPGQRGNTAFFGHSSNNIFNPGKYKFAFVLLHELVAGDTFYITYNHTVYIYKVFATRIVEPTEISVLDNVPSHAATATLITCDPPGTSLHRLVVVGDQISPDPSGNQSGTNSSATASSNQLPGNGPTLWTRILTAIGL